MNARFTNKLVKSSILVAAVAVALTGCGGSGANAGGNVATNLAATYTLEIVEGPSGSGLELRHVSPNGTAAGEYSIGNVGVCFTYKNGVRMDKTPVDKDCSISAVADDGSIEGEYDNGPEDVPFSTAGGTFHDISMPGGSVSGWGAGRDTNGNGYYSFDDSNNNTSAFRETAGVLTPLTVAGATNVGLSRTSPNGTVAGWANGGGTNGFYLFATGSNVGTKILDGDGVNGIYAINDSGTVAGSKPESGSNLPFVKIGGQLHTLPSPGKDYSAVYGLNAGNIAVGYLGILANNNFRAFGWTETDGTVDLNTRIPSTPGFIATIAHGVDRSGRIVGTGQLNGKSVGFILTPVNP
jgi:hypothetical protein